MALQLFMQSFGLLNQFLPSSSILYKGLPIGTFNFCISFLTSSTQRIFGLPIGLLEMGFQHYIALTILVSCILSMWPSHPNLCALLKFIIFLCFIILSNSWLVFICQIPFSLVGPNIFLKAFLSNTISLLVMVSFSVHVSHAYVTTGLISEQYNLLCHFRYKLTLKHLFICKEGFIS